MRTSSSEWMSRCSLVMKYVCYTVHCMKIDLNIQMHEWHKLEIFRPQSRVWGSGSMIAGTRIMLNIALFVAIQVQSTAGVRVVAGCPPAFGSVCAEKVGQKHLQTVPAVYMTICRRDHTKAPQHGSIRTGASGLQANNWAYIANTGVKVGKKVGRRSCNKAL